MHTQDAYFLLGNIVCLFVDLALLPCVGFFFLYKFCNKKKNYVLSTMFFSN